jgi:hypothetical protein
MRFTPGQQILFWLQLPKSAGSLYPVAHVSSVLTGLDLVGSPYPLTYSGNRDIYTGLGPIMGTDLLEVDYKVFSDSGLTQPSNRYFIYSDDIEPDFSEAVQTRIIVGPIKASMVTTNIIEGEMAEPIQAHGTLNTANEIDAKVISKIKIKGVMQVEEEIHGEL